MNHYTFDDITIGQVAEFKYDLTTDKMSKFMEISGDFNPLHCNKEYAIEKGYPECVVYGMLSASLLSTLAGMYLPGEYSLIESVELNFIKPVFISNSPLIIKAKVISKDERFSQFTLKYYIYDKNDDKVVRGTMKIGFTK